MKKAFLTITIISAVLLFQFCSSSKKTAGETAKEPTKEMAKEVAKITYTADVQPLLVAKCSPCHFPPRGNKEPLDTYGAAKSNIDDIIARIVKNPDDKGFMPMRHPKLSDSAIHVFTDWKQGGLAER